MCMLFIKPAVFSLPNAYFNSLWAHNSDGLSVLDIDSGVLYKELDKEKARTMLENLHDAECIVHFRFGTSGDATLDQLHGFNVCNDNYKLFHNGVLKSYRGDKVFSDTQQLVHDFKDKSFGELLAFLEENEKSSRFLIYCKTTKRVIKPNCAMWNDATTFDCGNEICFSNTYAIDYHLLGLYDNLYDLYPSGIYGKGGGFNTHTLGMPKDSLQLEYDSLYDLIDHADHDGLALACEKYPNLVAQFILDNAKVYF